MARPDKSDVRKKEILEAYFQVLAEEGLEGTSIAKVAARIGAHPSLIIHYFKTKDDMMIQLVDSIVEKHMRDFEERFHKISDPSKRLEAIIQFFLDANEGMSQKEAGVILAFQNLAFRNKKVRKRMQELFKRMEDKSLAEFEEFARAGLIDKKVLPKLNHVLQIFKYAANVLGPLMEEQDVNECRLHFHEVIRLLMKK